jgi:hypothetical protein
MRAFGIGFLALAVRVLPAQVALAENVALGKGVSCTSPPGIAWRGLLDGDRTSDQPPGCFATGADNAYPKKITIDLGAVYAIEQIVVYSSENGNTKTVEVWASRDGTTYERMRLPYVFADKTAQRMSAAFPPREARYVKVALLDTYGHGLGGDHVLFLREVEVYGRATKATASTRERPKPKPEAPRAARIFRHYVLRPGADLRLLVLGDDAAAAPQGGLPLVLAGALRGTFDLGTITVAARCEPGYTAEDACTYPVSSADESPDLVVVALGTADALAYNAEAFRSAVAALLERLQTRTVGVIVVVAPPEIPHAEQLGRAAESAGADTTEVAWQLADLTEGTEIAIVDAAAAIRESGLDVEGAYRDNLELTQAGHEAVARAIVRLFR